MTPSGFDPFSSHHGGENVSVGAFGQPIGGPPAGGFGMFGMEPLPEPELLPIPDAVRGFAIRLDLLDVKPPVWRRLEVPGDIMLNRLHDVVQAAMGWTGSHLHTFRTTNDRNPPPVFLTRFDLEEGDQGILEDDVRLDQVFEAKGDRLWYDYDFGDGWEHELRVEKVLADPPEVPRCVDGKLACPPEDCGGTGGYAELAAWVRGDYDEKLLPRVFENTEIGLVWLGDKWHPDVFDVESTNRDIALAIADPPPVTAELAELLEFERSQSGRSLWEMLARPESHGTTEVSAAAAAEATEPFRMLLEVIGDGANLTQAGYLKPADVEQIAKRAGIIEWWIGKANREDMTPPVADLRDTARALGLVSVRKGRISPTQAAKRCADDPQALLRHILGRLPLGKSQVDRHLGWTALAVVGSDCPVKFWNGTISGFMFDLGWRDGRDRHAPPHPMSPTLDALKILAGSTRNGWGRLPHEQVAAMARSVIRA
ncbi:MAG: plasmid pRiA4b ORF-3 family protein [Gulosibacter sp.]|uniref:plasmid pRiA4b ORF-3 family protein n=1 Tax=Gulosibacter sp. TaxID=2817531 RepID=UPI003F9179FA